MIVALAATQGQAEPHRPDGADAIRQHAGFVVLGLRSAFLGRQQQAVETRSDLLLLRAVRQQVAGQLFDRELVERLVLVERLDDPVAIRPDVPRVVRVVSDRVGKTDHIQPRDCHPFAVLRRGQQLVHKLLVGSGRRVGDKCFDLFRLGREADQVEVQPPGERAAVRFRRDLQSRLGQSLAHQMVDRLGAVRRGRFDRRLVRPMPLILAALGDPALDDRLLLVRQPLVRLRRRHDHVRIGAVDTGHDFAFVRLAGNNGLVVHRLVADVQPQLRLSPVLVRPVAQEAVVREDRANIAVELQFFLGGGETRDCHCERKDGNRCRIPSLDLRFAGDTMKAVQNPHLQLS